MAFPRWGFPLNYARYNIDLDLVTRGSGFGYYGSVDSKVIFATFTIALERTREALGLSAVVTRLQVFDVPHAVMSVPARLRLGGRVGPQLR